jgi:hypothetical protein
MSIARAFRELPVNWRLATQDRRQKTIMLMVADLHKKIQDAAISPKTPPASISSQTYIGFDEDLDYFREPKAHQLINDVLRRDCFGVVRKDSHGSYDIHVDIQVITGPRVIQVSVSDPDSRN